MDFVKTRPYLYHLTDFSNIEGIRETRVLAPAALLMKRAGREDLIKQHRTNHERVAIYGQKVLVRDQAPLKRANMTLPDDYHFEDFIENLNRRVFFWPGTSDHPIASGVNHFRRYQGEQPSILRVESQSLIVANAGSYPEYSRYNSGAPRWAHELPSPRGPNTFLPGPRFERSPCDVREVTFLVEIKLPIDTMVGRTPAGPWGPLFR